jgi:hypothetical protein
MATFSTSATVAGNPAHALRSAVTTLTNNNFAIVHCDDASATLTGPGLNSTRENPLLGATRVDLRVAGNRLDVDAELGGVDSMRRFLNWFPLLLGASLGLLFAVVGGSFFGAFGGNPDLPGGERWQRLLFALGAGLLPVAPWLVLSPMMASWIRNRTHRALETLANNAAHTAKLEKIST